MDARWPDIDRIVINTDQPKVDLQVSDTMGTRDAQNWPYFKLSNEQAYSNVVVRQGVGEVYAAGYGWQHSMAWSQASYGL